MEPYLKVPSRLWHCSYYKRLSKWPM